MPQFSLKQLLFSLVGFALVCVVLVQAVRGNILATGLIAGVVSLALFFAVFWLLASTAWAYCAIANRIFPSRAIPVQADTVPNQGNSE